MPPSPADDFGFPIIELPERVSHGPAAVLEVLLEELAQRKLIRSEHHQQILGQLLHREELGSTGIGRGIAIPHTRTECVEQVVGVIGKSKNGIAWRDAVDAAPVHVVVLFLCPASRPADGLRMMERIARSL